MVGFDFAGDFPKGITRNGGGASEFILPAGIGAREGLLTLILSAAIPTAAAAAVAILSRFIVTAVDVLAALVGWLYARSHHLISARRASLADVGSPTERTSTE